MNIEMLDTIALVAITIVVTLLLCKATGLFNGKTGATGFQGATVGRYLLFAGKDYYPLGGWEDFKGSFSELREAIYAGERQDGQPLSPDGYWYHIVDSSTGETVVTSRSR